MTYCAHPCSEDKRGREEFTLEKARQARRGMLRTDLDNLIRQVPKEGSLLSVLLLGGQAGERITHHLWGPVIDSATLDNKHPLEKTI